MSWCIPTLLQVFVEGHKGPDPNHPEILNDSNATEKLARYIDNVREKNGPDADWLTGEFDTEAAYKAGGGVPHGRLAIGDGVVPRRSYTRRSNFSAGSNRPRRPSAREGELLEKMTQMEESMAQYKQQVQQQMQQMQNWMLHQMYGGAGTQFGMPPFQQPPIITHPVSGQSSDRSTAAADGSQGSATSVQDQLMASGVIGGQMMPWAPRQPGIWPPMQTQMPPPMPWGFPPRGQSQSPGLPSHSPGSGSGSHHASPPPDPSTFMDLLMNTSGGGSNDPPTE